MTNHLLFHEDCNNDIDMLNSLIKNLDRKSLDIFRQQLITAYQLIYENPNCGTKFYDIIKDDFSLNFTMKYLQLPQFDCLIIYETKEHRKVIVLGIKPIKRSWNKWL